MLKRQHLGAVDRTARATNGDRMDVHRARVRGEASRNRSSAGAERKTRSTDPRDTAGRMDTKTTRRRTGHPTPGLGNHHSGLTRPQTSDDVVETLIKKPPYTGKRGTHGLHTRRRSVQLKGDCTPKRYRNDVDVATRLPAPLPRSSAVEKKLGQALRTRGHAPVAQQRVGPFFFDWALTKGTGKTQTRLDIEVDGRIWHESLPGTRSARDHRRDRIVSLLGWQPIRIWAEDVDQRIEVVVKRIEDALRLRATREKKRDGKETKQSGPTVRDQRHDADARRCLGHDSDRRSGTGCQRSRRDADRLWRSGLKELRETEADVDVAKNKLASLEETITALKTEAEEAREVITQRDAARQELEALQRQQNRIDAEVRNSLTRLDAQKEEIDALKTRRVDLVDDIAKARGEREQLQGEVNAGAFRAGSLEEPSGGGKRSGESSQHVAGSHQSNA